ncbi:hypothetical protein [Vescimonas sp.]|uniref:hypothetical protein n=1 Tax=Vescimonas sp. TaxID=2892404 RepID=UPI00307BAA17
MSSEIFEAGMLLCFGCSWPMNITKSIRARTAKGKSLAFELFVLVGYICGITGKCISGSINWVFAIYILDLLMVATDILLTLRNRRLDKRKEAAQ